MHRRAVVLAAGTLAMVQAFGFVPAMAQQAAPVSAAGTPAETVPPRIPAHTFATWPIMRWGILSPDGKGVLSRIANREHEALGVFDVTDSKKSMVLDIPKDFELRRARWACNGTVLVTLGKSVIFDGDDAYMERLIAFDRASGKGHFLGSTEEGLDGADVIWVDPEGKHLLLSYQATIYEYPSVVDVDIKSGGRRQVVSPHDGIWDWWADHDGVVRYGTGFTEMRHWTVVYRKTAKDRFNEVVAGAKRYDEDRNFSVQAILPGSDDGYVSSTNEKTGLAAIYKYNFATRTRGDLVFESPDADVERAIMSDDGATIDGVRFTDSASRVHWFEPKLKAFQEDLHKAIVGSFHDSDYGTEIMSQSHDHAQRLIKVGAPNDPGSIYYYQEADGKMVLLSRVNPGLLPSQLAKPRYVHYAARDGLEIHAYLTLPRGRTAKNLPLIVFPHGGPFDVRDDDGYDDDVQFLANRGYAVLQPEYRGSGSYGKAFYEKARGQWGRAMQDDLDDGMDWLVHQGIADPKRVCIVGASYGGYAAMWGATRNPERYRCAVSLAGVSDVGRQVRYSFRDSEDHTARADFQGMVQGAKDFDLKTVSPLYNIDKMKVPILLVHGDKDERVLPKQSKLYADALQAAGKTYEYYILPGNGHGNTTPAGSDIWFAKLDAFLAKYNPAE